MSIVSTVSSWFRSTEREAEAERPRDLAHLPVAPDGTLDARPKSGTMCVEPLRPSGTTFFPY